MSDSPAHYVPTISDAAQSRQKRRRLLSQHRLAWRGCDLFSLLTICLLSSLAFAAYHFRIVVSVCHKDFSAAYVDTGRNSAPSVPSDEGCIHFPESYIDALKGSMLA